MHWNAETWRFLPSDFELKTHLTERYGEKFLPADMTIQDWGVSYDELEPHYDKFEHLCGTSGKAGKIKGQIQAGGNPFEGSRSREYPTPPQKQPYGPTLFAQAAAAMGYKPFPQPSGNLSQAYTNPLGVTLGPCTYLRVLRMVRVWQLLESQPADHDPARTRALPQFRGPHAVRGVEDQPG